MGTRSTAFCVIIPTRTSIRNISIHRSSRKDDTEVQKVQVHDIWTQTHSGGLKGVRQEYEDDCTSSREQQSFCSRRWSFSFVLRTALIEETIDNKGASYTFHFAERKRRRSKLSCMIHIHLASSSKHALGSLKSNHSRAEQQ